MTKNHEKIKDVSQKKQDDVAESILTKVLTSKELITVEDLINLRLGRMISKRIVYKGHFAMMSAFKSSIKSVVIKINSELDGKLLLLERFTIEIE